MNRNKAPIETNDQVLNGFRAVYLITKLLKLSQQHWFEMGNLDVFNKIEEGSLSAPEKRLLVAFASGVQQTYTTVLMTEHCEFVYLLTSGAKVGVGEATCKGPQALVGASCGYRWIDSEFDFTEFVAAEVDLWI